MSTRKRDNIAVYETSELFVLKGFQERRKGFCFAGLAVDIFALLDIEGRDEHGSAGNRGHDGHGKADGTRLPTAPSKIPARFGSMKERLCPAIKVKEI